MRCCDIAHHCWGELLVDSRDCFLLFCIILFSINRNEVTSLTTINHQTLSLHKRCLKQLIDSPHAPFCFVAFGSWIGTTTLKNITKLRMTYFLAMKFKCEASNIRYLLYPLITHLSIHHHFDIPLIISIFLCCPVRLSVCLSILPSAICGQTPLWERWPRPCA